MRLLHPRMAVVSVVAILALVLNVAVPMAFASEGGPSATLTVRVVDADEIGRPEVSVRIGTGPAEEGNVVTVVTTDQAGEATLELEPGSYWVSAVDTDLALEAGRYVTLEDGLNAVKLTLDTAKKTGIQGAVQGPTAILTVTSGEQWWRVERPQQYSIELPPLDPGHLYIFTVQYGSSYYERPFEVRAGTVTTMPTVFTDPAQQGCSDATISLELPSDSDALPVYVEFLPVSSTGEVGCHDLAVDLQDRGVHNGRWYATLDSGGSAKLNGMAPGEYDVVVGFEDQQGQQWQDIVATNVTLLEGTNPIELLASDRLMIRGVAKINGNPAANTKVVAWEVSEKYGFHVGEAVTDEQGNFEMVVPQGTIQFCLERNCIPVEVQGGPEFNVGTLDFGDHSPAPWPTGDNSLQVVVTDADGNPAAGAWVSVDYWSAEDQGWLQVWSGETDDSGVAAINNVPSGTYRISVGRGIGQTSLRFQQEVELDETKEVVEITAPSEISEGKSGVQGRINVDGEYFYATITFVPVDEHSDSLRREWAVDVNGGETDYSVALPEGKYAVSFDYWDGEGGWVQSVGGMLDVKGVVALKTLDINSGQCLSAGGHVLGVESGIYDYDPEPNVWLADWVRIEYVRSLDDEASPATPCDWITDTFEQPFWEGPIWDRDSQPDEWSLEGLPAGHYMIFTDPYKVLEDGELIGYTYFQYRSLAESIHDMVLEFGEPATVTGRVVRDGAPWVGVEVTLWPNVEEDWVRVWTVVTDENGEFTFYSMPGEFYLLAGGAPLGDVFKVADWGQNVSLGDLTPQQEVTEPEPEPSPEPGPAPEPAPTPEPAPEPKPSPEPSPAPEPTPPPMPGPQPAPAPQPAPTPEPTPEPGSTPVTVLEPDRIAEAIAAPGSEASFTLPSAQPVEIPAAVVDQMVSAGKQAVRFDYGEVEVHLPLANLDINRLASVNPDLASLAGQADAQLRFSVKEVQPSNLPAGYIAAGGLYEISLEVHMPEAEPVAVNRLPVPVEISVPVTWTGDPVLVGLWYQEDDGDLIPVPSWPSDDGELTAALRHFSRYVVAARQPAFKDLEGHWARRNIEAAYAHGIVNGFDETAFVPNQAVSRIEFVAMLTRALGLEPNKDAAQRFRDLSPAWEGVAGAAYQAGLVRGVSASRFEPNRQLSRLELAVMIGRALKAHGFNLTEGQVAEVLSQFKDRSAVPAWAREAVALAVHAGVVRGVRRDELVLNRTATRAETATIAVRFLEAWLREDGEE